MADRCVAIAASSLKESLRRNRLLIIGCALSPAPTRQRAPHRAGTPRWHRARRFPSSASTLAAQRGRTEFQGCCADRTWWRSRSAPPTPPSFHASTSQRWFLMNAAAPRSESKTACSFAIDGSAGVRTFAGSRCCASRNRCTRSSADSARVRESRSSISAQGAPTHPCASHVHQVTLALVRCAISPRPRLVVRRLLPPRPNAAGSSRSRHPHRKAGRSSKALVSFTAAELSFIGRRLTAVRQGSAHRRLWHSAAVIPP